LSAFVLAKLLALPPVAAGVIALFAAMPTGANAYIFAAQNVLTCGFVHCHRNSQ